MHIDENKLGSEIMRLAGGRIVIACLACAGIGGVIGAIFF